MTPLGAWRLYRELQRLNYAYFMADLVFVLAAGDKASMDQGWPQHVAFGRYVNERPLPGKGWMN